MTWSVGAGAWKGEGEVLAVISRHIFPQLALDYIKKACGRLPLETHVGLRKSPLEIHLGQIRIAYVTNRILGRI